jgi:hypothetical protein
MSSKVLPIWILAPIFLVASVSFAAVPNLASEDWSAKAPQNLAAHPPSDHAVAAFVAQMEDGGKPNAICYARFADLRHSGNLSLVVATSYGRACNLTIYDKTSSGFEESIVPLAHYADRPEIKDLGGDDNLELVVPTDLSSYYGGQHCMAEWPVIYAWTGSDYTDASSRYKDYYKQELASLQKDIVAAKAKKERAEQWSAVHGPEAAESADSGAPEGLRFENPAPAPDGSQPASVVIVNHGPNGSVGITTMNRPVLPPPLKPPATPPPDRLGLDCTKAAAAKIERYLGISRDAGMTDAIKWADSDDPNDREFAVEMLADIGTPEANEYLGTLSHDSNREVASSAKEALVSHGSEVYKAEREPVADAAGKPIK